MAGNARFESPSASSSEPGFSGTYSNGKRGTHSVSGGPNLDRSGSFREGAESRLFSVSRGGSNSMVASSGHFPSLSQCLSLDPIPMGDRKIDRSVELRRVMGLLIGTTNEDNNNSSGPSGPSSLKPSPPVTVSEDLKRFRSSVADTCVTARGRASKLDEHLHKLDKYCDGVISKKPQRNELVTNDQPSALNSKISTQIYRDPTELVNQDRPKNVLLNKRVRTSVAETRAELRNNGLRRQPPVVMAKDRDLIKDNNGESDMLEEKIQRLPAVGEGWDKKMKRKRSVGPVFTRPMDNNNGDPKRIIQNKVASEPGLQSNDAHPYRLGASNGTGNIHKLDNKLEGTSNSSRVEGPGVSRDLIGGPNNKERILTKGSNKLNTRDDSNYTPCASPLTKGKASRTPRNGASSSPSTPRVSTSETWENPTGGGKIPSSGPTNRKRAMPAGPSSPSMAQWGSQRPQKMSRTRRANLVSPVSNQEEKQLSSDSCSHSDISIRLTSDGPTTTTANGPVAVSKQFKPNKQPEVVQSPHRMSESEESVGGESRLKEKGKGNGGDSDANGNVNVNVNGNGNVNVNEGQNVVPLLLPAGVKVKSVINDESGEGGVRRQGRIGRGPLIARANGEKMDNNAAAMIKPIQRNRPGYEKNGSNKGRPLKKLSERKGFSRLGHLQNNGKDFPGKSEDDREELLAAANHARNASYLACSSLFWKKMESIFAPISSKDRFYLSMQLKSEQDVQGNFSQFHGRENNIVVNFPNEERNGHVKHQGSESFSGRLESDKTSKEFIPLFQRVLSALIIEDTIDDLEEEDEQQQQDTGIIIPVQDSFCDSGYEMDDYEPRKKARREFECDTVFGVHAQSPHSVKVSFSISGCSNSFRSPSINDSPCEDVHSEVELLAGISKDLQMESFNISSFDNKYEQMRVEDKLLLELQSIGLYPELVPNLDDKEDEAIKHEIDQLKIRLRQQNGKKKACLEKVCKGVGGSYVGRDLEQVAIDRLVELAHRKLLATRGASRGGIPKVPKQVALAFGRRTLARCRKFAKSGISCFNVPTLRDVLFAPQDHELDPTPSVPNNTTTTTKYIGFQNPHQDSRLLSSDDGFGINGPISNRGKKKELLLDDVGGKRCDQRKTKPKLKQKTAGVVPMSGNGFGNNNNNNNQFTGRTLHPVQPSVNVERRDIRMMVSEENKEMMPLHELDPLDELGVGTDLGGAQDLSSLLNFDDEELQDQFTAGLDIPMDDLAELNMF